MPKLSSHSSGDFVKLLLIGNSGTGKTGALASLVRAGYELRIIDLDNGLDALKNLLAHEDPKLLELVEYESARDRYKTGITGPTFVPPPKGLRDAGNLIDKWSDDSVPAEWGPKRILVIDSLTMLGRCALNWATNANPTLRDPRLWYGAAQDVVEKLIATVTGESFGTNVIVISHIDYVIHEETKLEKGFVSAVGKALGPKLPRYFNTLLLAETRGSGEKVRRTIRTMPTTQIDLKNPAPMRISAEYPLDTGLNEIFTQLKAV